MPRIIELMRQSAVPAAMMRTAAKGALQVAPAEMIEILVYLTSNPVFAEQAKMTLAGWDEKSSIAVCADPATPWEVLDYFLAPQNRRPKLLPALIENPSVRQAKLLELAQTPSREIVEMMLASQRVRRSPDVLHALGTNHHVKDEEQEIIRQALRGLGETPAEIEAYDHMVEGEKSQYEIEHAAEIAAEEGKPFELVGGFDDSEAAPPAEGEATPAAPAAAPAAPAAAAAAAVPAGEQKPERERISPLQKIARLTVGQRVQLAMKGNKEERYILVRDGSKVVSEAVLESPKLTDSEVETFAAMKNVQECVLRAITRKRKFMKNYAVIRCLVNNPRTPLDLSLQLLNHLLVNDLKSLSTNKNVSDTVRKMGLKLFKTKSQPAGGKRSE